MNIAFRHFAPGIVMALLAIAPPQAGACSCLPPGDVLESMGESEAVFLGTVVNSATHRSGDAPWWARIKSFFGMQVNPQTEDQRVSLRIDEPFKGVGAATVEVTTASSSAACGYTFEIGRQYVVFASRNDGNLWVSLCSSTARLQDFPAADLERLRNPGR